MMVLDARARARSTHLGIGDDVLRNVGRALAQTHARTHGEFGFGFGIERAIDRMNASRCVESSRSDACAGMGWDALDSCVRARTHSSTRMVTMTDIGRTCGRAFERDVVVVVRGRGRGREVRTRVAGTSSGTSSFESESARVVYATSRALDHACEGHPESNARVPAIEEALTRNGLTPETRQGGGGDCRVRVGDDDGVGGGAREELRARVGVGVREERADAFGQCADVLHRVELSRRHVRVGRRRRSWIEVIARGGGRRPERVWVDSTAGTSRGAERSDGVLSGRYGRGGGRNTRKRRGFKRFSSLITTCITETGRMISFTTIPACSSRRRTRTAVIPAPAK